MATEKRVGLASELGFEGGSTGAMEAPIAEEVVFLGPVSASRADEAVITVDYA